MYRLLLPERLRPSKEKRERVGKYSPELNAVAAGAGPSAARSMNLDSSIEGALRESLAS